MVTNAELDHVREGGDPSGLGRRKGKERSGVAAGPLLPFSLVSALCELAAGSLLFSPRCRGLAGRKRVLRNPRPSVEPSPTPYTNVKQE